MKINSPLTNLCDVLRTVEETALKHKDILSSNEDATRAALVDPVLHALGWNTGNVSMVVVEKVMPGYHQLRADYVLYGRNDQAVAVIEAKPPGTNLKQIYNQMVNYATAFHVTSVFLTDGLVWQHFKTDNLNTAHVVPQVTHNVSEQTLSDMAVYLIQHLDAAHFWPEEQTVDALSNELEQLRGELTTLQQHIQILAAGGAVLPPASPTEDWTPLKSVTGVTHTHPSKFRLPDGTILTVKHWRDVLIEACKYVLAWKLDVPVPYTDALAGGGKLLRSEAPTAGISYFSMIYQGQTIYIYSNYDAPNCVKNAKYILNLLPSQQKPVEPAVVYS